MANTNLKEKIISIHHMGVTRENCIMDREFNINQVAFFQAHFCF